MQTFYIYWGLLVQQRKTWCKIQNKKKSKPELEGEEVGEEGVEGDDGDAGDDVLDMTGGIVFVAIESEVKIIKIELQKVLF